MKRAAACAWLLAVALAALGLFHVKYEVQRLEMELSHEQGLILEHREAIHVLKAEWSFLNQPTRISKLAARHLGLAPMSSRQIVQVQELPLRQARESQTSGSNLEATLASTESQPGTESQP